MLVVLVLVVVMLATIPALAGPSDNFCPSSGTVVVTSSIKNDRVFARCYDGGVQLWRITCMKATVLQTPVEGGVLVSCVK